MSRLELINDKPIIRRIHINGNSLSVGLPKEIISKLKVEPSDYLKVFYDSKNKAIIYKLLEDDVTK